MRHHNFLAGWAGYSERERSRHPAGVVQGPVASRRAGASLTVNMRIRRSPCAAIPLAHSTRLSTRITPMGTCRPWGRAPAPADWAEARAAPNLRWQRGEATHPRMPSVARSGRDLEPLPSRQHVAGGIPALKKGPQSRHLQEFAADPASMSLKGGK